MFTNHFKLNKVPFTETLAVNRLLKDTRVQEGLLRFKYMVENGHAGLLTGQSGVGKTCLLNLFMKSLSRNKYRPVYINLTSLEPRQFLRLILIKLDEIPGNNNGKEKNFLLIKKTLESEDVNTVLIIDEAHLLKDGALKDLRLLINVEPGKTNKLKILLSGLDSISRKLKSNHHQSLKSRISAFYNLNAFNREQSSSYIDFCIKNAGGNKNIFDDDAKLIIYEYSKGVPRNINNIATASLMHAASKKLSVIDETLVITVMEELLSV